MDKQIQKRPIQVTKAGFPDIHNPGNVFVLGIRVFEFRISLLHIFEFGFQAACHQLVRGIGRV